MRQVVVSALIVATPPTSTNVIAGITLAAGIPHFTYFALINLS